MVNPLAADVVRTYELERRVGADRGRERPRSFRQDVQRVRLLRAFRGLRRSQIAALLRLADTVELPAGRRLATQGGPVRQWIILLAGEAAVRVDERPDRLLRPGDHVGLDEILEGGCARGTVTTVGPVEVLVLGRRETLSLLFALPSLATRLLGRRVRRQRRTRPLPHAAQGVAGR